MDNYEEKYKQALRKALDLYNQGLINPPLEHIFPELTENEDGRIRKGLIEYLKADMEYNPSQNKSFYKKSISWLEKQGQKPKKVSIWKHWKDGIAGNGEGKQIYLIKTGNTYNLSSVLSFECDYIELSELDNLLLEKQGEKVTNINGEDYGIDVNKKVDRVIGSAEHIKTALDVLNKKGGEE